MIKFAPWVYEVSTLQSKYPLKKRKQPCEPTGHKRAKVCCYMIDKENRSLQKPDC